MVINDCKGNDGLWNRAFTLSGDRVQTRAWNHWNAMFTRCNPSPARSSKFPTYDSCRMSINFKDFQYFAEWCQKQIGYGLAKSTLDKDILLKGNKLYSEDLCVFVPVAVNSLFTKRDNDRGPYPLGVSLSPTTVLNGNDRYRVNCSQGGRQIYLGTFGTVTEAFSVYKQNKERVITEVAEYYKDVLDARVYTTMNNYCVEISD